MESFKPKTQSAEQGNPKREQYLKKFFNRHVAAILLSLASFQVSEKPAEAQQTKMPAIEQADPVALEKDRRQALEDFKALVDKNKIDEIVSEQEKRFGMAAGSLFINRAVSLDLRQMKNLYAKKDDPRMFVSKDGTQYATLGSMVANAYKERWLRQEPVKRTTELKNIEAVPGLSVKELKDFFSKTYPKGYVESCISSIEFISQSDIRKEENVEILGQVQPYGMTTMFGNKNGDLRAPVKMNLPVEGITKEAFLDVLQHEIGHAFDPLDSSILTSAERVLMLEDIYQRSVSSDRYLSQYVESITNEKLGIYFRDAKITGPDEQKQFLALIKANEYWAEIHKAYFLNKEQFQKEHPADYAVVKKWVDAISK